MKNIGILAIALVLVIACKNAESTKDDSTVTTALAEELIDTKPIEVVQKIKKITKKDFSADYKYGKYTKDALVSTVTETFNEESLINKVTIDLNEAEGTPTVYSYVPKMMSDTKVALYNDSNELIEIEVHENNTMYSYEVENPEEPTLVRKYDEKGNHLMDISNSDGNLYVTTYDIVAKDANGFATSSNALWVQYKKPNHLDFYAPDFSNLEVISKSYQVVDFEYELYQ
jgi:hypothetical protein